MLLLVAGGCYLAALLLWRLPVRCIHGCAICDEDERQRRRRASERQHAYLHETFGQEDCPLCRKR